MAMHTVRKRYARKRRAKIIDAEGQRQLIEHIKSFHRHPSRDQVLVLLSFRAGLRAAEIAGVNWPMLLNSSGKVGDFLDLEGQICKKGSARTIPMC